MKIFYNDNFHVRLKEIVKFEVEILCCSSMSSIIQLKFFYLKKSLIKIKPVVYNGSSEKKKKICFSWRCLAVERILLTEGQMFWEICTLMKKDAVLRKRNS